MSVGLAARWVAASYVLGMLAMLAVNAFAARLVGDDFGYFIACVPVSAALAQLGLMGVHRGGLRDAARMSHGRNYTTRGDVTSLVWTKNAVQWQRGCTV